MSHSREAVAFVAAKLLVSKFQAGMLPVPGSPAIRESVELAHALLADVEAFEVVLEQREVDAAKAKAEAERLEGDRLEGEKKSAELAAAAQKEHDRLEAEKVEAEKKKAAAGATTVVTPPK